MVEDTVHTRKSVLDALSPILEAADEVDKEEFKDLISALEEDPEKKLTPIQNKTGTAFIEALYAGKEDVQDKYQLFVKSLADEKVEEEEIKASIFDRFPEPVRNVWMLLGDAWNFVKGFIGSIFDGLKKAFFNNLRKLRGSSEREDIDTVNQRKRTGPSTQHQEEIKVVDHPHGMWSHVKRVLPSFGRHKSKQSSSSTSRNEASHSSLSRRSKK